MCEHEKGHGQSSVHGRVGGWSAGPTGHSTGLCSGATDLEEVLWGTPLSYPAIVPTPIWTMCELLLVQAYQGSNSVLHVRPCGEEKASS